MKEIIRWDPFKEISSLREEIDKLFDSFFGRKSFLFETESFIPACDLEETEDAFIVTAELPGMKKEDIKITVDEDGLTISGERKREKEEKGKTYHRIERSYGRFQRYIPFPKEVQPEKAKATYKDGILKIEIPKSDKVKPKEIKIEIEE
jgi:HSP20 family protein